MNFLKNFTKFNLSNMDHHFLFSSYQRVYNKTSFLIPINLHYFLELLGKHQTFVFEFLTSGKSPNLLAVPFFYN